MKNIVCLMLLGVVATVSAQESLIAPGAQVEKVVDGFAFTEGPAVDANGDLYFIDDPRSQIFFWSVAKKELKVFKENSGHANGTFVDKKGNLIACEGETGSIVSYDPQGNRTVVADKFDGKRFNKPNDLWIAPNGGIYFTDPVYGKEFKVVQDGEHVYYILPDRSKTIRVVDDMTKPNGIIGTPDGKTLYITDQVPNKVWRYDIQPDGTLTGKKLFAERGVDGMTIDEKGNIYITDSEIAVFDPEGKLIQTIKTPEVPANVCFAGPDRKTLYVTARKGVYSIKMNVKGVQ